MASFRSLPPELLLEIAGWLDDQYSLSSLVRANRTCHAILTETLFIKYGREAVRWAARNGKLDILKAATIYARAKKRELLNANYVFEDLEFNPDVFDDPMYVEKHGAPLHIACAAGHIDIVNYLLDNGADIDAPSSRMCDCLYMDDSLGEYYGDDDMLDRPKWLPLHYALCHKHPDVAILLLERKAPLYVSASSASKGRYSVTALQSAAENGLVTVVRYLKEYFQKQKAVLEGEDPSGSADVQGAENGLDASVAQNEDTTESQDSDSDVEDGDPFDSDMSDFDDIDHGDDLDSEEDDDLDSDSDSDSSSDDSDASVDSADTDELDFWGQSADPSDPRSADLYGNTAMHYVSLCFDYEAACIIVEELKELGLNVDERGGRRDATPLLMACCMGNFSAARAFLRAGAYPEATLEEDFVEYAGLEGDTTCLDNALHARFTRRAGREQSHEKWKEERRQFIRELIKAGVDVEELPGTSGATPLGIAAQRGLEEEVKLLLELGGAYVNGMAEGGKTALMAAAQRQQVNTVKILLEAGASVNQTTGFGVTAVDFACSIQIGFRPTYYGNAEDGMKLKAEAILKLLLEYGARVGIPVEDALATTMCRSHPCIHDSFLLKTVRRATIWQDEDDEDIWARGLLNVLLDHATEANITRDCWQAAIMEAFSPLKSEPANPEICKKLGAFGARLGYVFDDSTLANIIVKLIVADDPADIGPLFMLGDGETVRTVTGVLTKTALLTLILVRHHCEDGGSGEGSKLVGPLLQSVKNVKGTIKLLKNKGTLLHLAASGKNSAHVKTLLDKGCDFNAMSLHGMTPLAEAVQWGDIKSVKLLLDRGADPYMSNSTLASPRLPDSSEDVLGLPSGQRLARAFVELLAKFDCFQEQYLDEPSPFEIAVRKGRNAMLEEFIKRKKVLPPIPPEAKTSYMTDACINGYYQTAHMLLRAGADPNGGDGVETPPIVQLCNTLPLIALVSSGAEERDFRREEVLKRLGVISHLVRAGADVNRKSKLTKTSAVMLLERVLQGLPVTAPDPYREVLPLTKIVGEVLTIKEDPETGVKTIKCRNRGIDSWVR